MDDTNEENEKDTVENQGRTKKRSLSKSSSEEQATPTPIKQNLPTRKRKYAYTTGLHAPNKCKRFYFITESMTKPRRLKVGKAVELEEKNVEKVPGKRPRLTITKVDDCGNAFLVDHSCPRRDLFFNDEKLCSYEDSKVTDLSFHVMDEIALEGLDGITLEAFWKRLKNVFPNNISKSMADRIWRLICNNKRLAFYVLQEPREKLISFDRCKYMDADDGVFVEPFVEFKDVYPLSSVNGVDVRGSCSTFSTRKENNGVRKFSMEKANKLYGQKLVIVADQLLRNKALISEEADPSLELLDLEYCMLERIGRSRTQGELTQGKMSLQCGVSDSKSVYHNRKVLLKNVLIVQQFFYIKSLETKQNMSGGLVHLSRFYNKKKTKRVLLMEQISNLLKQRPNYQIEFSKFQQIFGRNRTLARLVKSPDFRRFFKICAYPYRKLYPNAHKHEYMIKSQSSERQIRVLHLIDPYANVIAAMDSKDFKETQHENISDSPGCKLFNYEFLRDIFLFILSTGTIGATIQEVHEYLNMDFYSVRMAMRKLLLRNVISSRRIDLGRQQSLKFFAKCFIIPDCHVETQSKDYQLSDETISRILKNYENVPVDNIIFYSEPEFRSMVVPNEIHIDIDFEPFCCTAFLTEAIDANSEELTIYDIVIKGRDKLLLIESNLFAHYISEWDDFHLKRDDFSKTAQIFQNGFGKIIYDFLKTVRINEKIVVDNFIVFDIANVTPETTINRLFHGQRAIEIDKNFINPCSSYHWVDVVSKIYLLEAMFNQNHLANHAMQKLKNIFAQVMIDDGKKQRENLAFVKVEPNIQVEVCSNVLMETFMGSNPVMKWREEDDGIKIEIFASTEPTRFVDFGTMYSSNDVNLTQRYIDRANVILKCVYDESVVKDARTLFKSVRREEDNEGYDKKVCKKSVDAIISKLVKEGYIKIFKVVMTGKNMSRAQSFICVPHIDVNNDFIRSTIEQMKLKFCVGVSQNQQTIKIMKKVKSPFTDTDVKNSIIELKQLSSNTIDPSYKNNKNIGKKYGFTPKFVRMQVLHEYLFYVIRELSEIVASDNRQIVDLCKNLKIKLEPGDVATMPPTYRNEISWKMFIPSLPANTNWPKGWALACDIILRMPLSVFVKLYNVQYEIPELETFLQHPIKRHYLLKFLPVSTRHVLLHKRKYFHTIYETLSHLCYMGLMQLGPRSFREKDQIFIYLNWKASLYDTCSSKPGYNLIEEKKYKKIPFEFKSGNDVEIYWSEMLRICMNTPLGKRKILDGQCVVIEDCHSKPTMVATLYAKTFEGAVKDDTGKIPGDKRGSAGLDSTLWTYVKRNWTWCSQRRNKASKDIEAQVTGLKKEKFDVTIPQPIPYHLAEKVSPERKYQKPGKITKKSSVKAIVIKKTSNRNLVRKIVVPQKKRVREYYDPVDKSIMKKIRMIRVDWEEKEDQLLRYARVASVFLCPESKKQFIPYNIIRDVLHRLCPASRNKTARAIQRRIYVLLTGDETVKTMEANIENFLNSDTIAKYFEHIHNRYRRDIKITDAQVYISFVYLMAYITKHRKEVELLLLGYVATVDFFSDSNLGDFEAIVQYVEDGNSTLIYKNPQTVEDVTKDTIKSVIHCSMSCKKNSVGWTFHLSHIYKKFPDAFIRMAVVELKKNQFFVTNKNYDSKSFDNSWPIPLKFSYMYNVMRSPICTIDMFLEAYQNFVGQLEQSNSKVSNFVAYNELCSFWDQSIFNFEIPEMAIILNPEIEDHSEVIEELSNRFRSYLCNIYERNGAAKEKSKNEAVKVENSGGRVQNPEKQIEELKTDVRHLIFRVPYLLEGNLELNFKRMLDNSNSLEINSYISLMITDLKQFAQETNSVKTLKDFIDNIEDDCNVDDQYKLMRNLSKVVFAIQTILQQNIGTHIESFEDAFNMWETNMSNEVKSKDGEERNSNVPRFSKKSSSGMEHCIKQAQAGVFPDPEEIKEGMMAEFEDTENRKIPHITDLVILLAEDRCPELDTDNETVEKMIEHFVIQYPKLQDFCIQEVDKLKNCSAVKTILQESKIEQVKRATENVVQPVQLDQIISYVRRLNGTEEDIEVTENLIDFIKSKRELGASPKELKVNFFHKCGLELANLLQFLTEIGVVLRAGVVSVVYVHYEYQSEWLTETFLITVKEEVGCDSAEKQKMKKLKSIIGEKLDLAESRKVQLMPWTKLDGSLNSELFREWLCIILSRCVEMPGIPLLALCEQFHYLKPVDVYYLLEILQILGCIEICVFHYDENTIFSSRRIVDKCPATCLDSFENMFIEPMNISGLSFGYFLDKDILNIC